MRAGIDQAIARGLSYAPYADMIWCETAEPKSAEAKKFAESVHAKFPDKLLAYNCSPSFNWKKKLDAATIAKFQRELGAMGYKFQFVTLAGFHALNYSMFNLAQGYRERGMAAYSELQEAEFAAEEDGYTATKHQHEVGTGYFDDVAQVIAGGESFDHRAARLDRAGAVLNRITGVNVNRARRLKERRSPVRRLRPCPAAGMPLSIHSASDGCPAVELHHGRRTGDRRSLSARTNPSWSHKPPPRR